MPLLNHTQATSKPHSLHQSYTLLSWLFLIQKINNLNFYTFLLHKISFLLV